MILKCYVLFSLFQRFFYFSLCSPEEIHASEIALEQHQHLAIDVQNIEFGRITEFNDKEDFKALFPGGRAMIGWTPYRIDCKSNFTLTHRFPEHFAVTYDENCRLTGVSFHTVLLDGERNWERRNFEVFCDTKETCLKHTAFHLKDVLRTAQHRNLYVATNYSCSGRDDSDFEELLRFRFGFSESCWPHVTYIPLVCDTQYFT